MRHFRIVTYNIHKGRGMDGRSRVERIARVLEGLNADIIALQEVLNH
jgi:endonuclease/exonuclease/phosphatase family metal-dependent hydrolase